MPWLPEQTRRASEDRPCGPLAAMRGECQARGYALIRPEPEHLRCIVRGDCASVRLGNTLKDAAQEILRFRPGGFGMREVAAPQHCLDADLVAHLHAELVFHELDEHVALPVIAG